MAYTPTEWKDRVVQYPNRYKDQADTQYTFTRDEGTITEAGTQITALNMNKIEAGINNLYTIRNATITTTWVGTSPPYTQEVTISGIESTDVPVISPIFSENLTTSILEKESWNMINRAVTGTNKITFYCFEEKPTQAINIQIKGE